MHLCSIAQKHLSSKEGQGEQVWTVQPRAMYKPALKRLRECTITLPLQLYDIVLSFDGKQTLRHFLLAFEHEA